MKIKTMKNKIPRFVREYAAATIQAAENNKLMRESVRAEIIARCQRTIKLLENNFITADEAVMLIHGPVRVEEGK